MVERTIDDWNVKTQSLDAVRAFLKWKGRAVDPMPSTIEFIREEGRMVLVLSNEKASYYITTTTKNALVQAQAIAAEGASISAITPTRAGRDRLRGRENQARRPMARWLERPYGNKILGVA